MLKEKMKALLESVGFFKKSMEEENQKLRQEVASLRAQLSKFQAGEGSPRGTSSPRGATNGEA